MTNQNSPQKFSTESRNRILRVLERAATQEKLSVKPSEINLADLAMKVESQDEVELLKECARQAGLELREIPLSASEAKDVLFERMQVLLVFEDRTMWLFESQSGKRVEASKFGETAEPVSLTPEKFDSLFEKTKPFRTFVISRELECTSLSNASDHHGHHSSADGHGDHHHHPGPLSRFIGLLQLDQRDILTVALFALVSGFLSLATPLAVESLVNVVSWGTYLQPLLVLGMLLLACLALASVLSVLQYFVVEIIQRRQFVRIISDLAHRFPRVKQNDLSGVYSREYANRIFDVMTIQKSTASLLVDGISIVLATVLGMLLLGFYHPFLLGFDIVLLTSMVSVTWLLGRGGISTAIDESITKYKIIHWLQDVIAAPGAFKVNGGERLAIERANQLSTEYILARQKQFRVTVRQFIFAVGLQSVASTAILALGGWLVIQQQLTLGQLVASELVVTVVVGAFSKAGKLYEKFYDLMAAVDKVGHLLDLSVDGRQATAMSMQAPAEITWSDLELDVPYSSSTCSVAAASVSAGSRVALVGGHEAGRSQFIRLLAGLHAPSHGSILVNGLDTAVVALSGDGLVGFCGAIEVIHASIAINVSLGKSDVGQSHIRDSLEVVGLAGAVATLRDGIDTPLQSDGQPLSQPQLGQLMLARAIVSRPRLLLIDRSLDNMDAELRSKIWSYISDAARPWTLVLVSNDQELVDRCSQKIVVA